MTRFHFSSFDAEETGQARVVRFVINMSYYVIVHQKRVPENRMIIHKL